MRVKSCRRQPSPLVQIHPLGGDYAVIAARPPAVSYSIPCDFYASVMCIPPNIYCIACRLFSVLFHPSYASLLPSLPNVSLSISLTPAQAVCGIWIRSGLRACAMTVSEHSSSLSSFVTRNPILLVPAPQNIRFEIDHFRGFPSFYSGKRLCSGASPALCSVVVSEEPDRGSRARRSSACRHQAPERPDPYAAGGYGTLPRCLFLGRPFSGSERAEGRMADNLDTQRTHIA